MSPAEFGAFATGKTLAYAENGQTWGRETYLPGRKVMWRAVGKTCLLGQWRPVNGEVCFDYQGGVRNQCWLFARGQDGQITATFLNKPGTPPASVTEEPKPVSCPGPLVGS